MDATILNNLEQQRKTWNKNVVSDVFELHNHEEILRNTSITTFLRYLASIVQVLEVQQTTNDV